MKGGRMEDGGRREKGRGRRGHGRGGREEGRGEEDMERKRGEKRAPGGRCFPSSFGISLNYCGKSKPVPIFGIYVVERTMGN